MWLRKAHVCTFVGDREQMRVGVERLEGGVVSRDFALFARGGSWLTAPAGMPIVIAVRPRRAVAGAT